MNNSAVIDYLLVLMRVGIRAIPHPGKIGVIIILRPNTVTILRLAGTLAPDSSGKSTIVQIGKT